MKTARALLRGARRCSERLAEGKLRPLEGDANLQLNTAHGRSAVCSAEAGVLRQRTTRSYAAVRIELVILQRHGSGVVECCRCAEAVDNGGVQCVEDVGPELEPARFLELPEAESPNHGRIDISDRTAPQIVAPGFQANAAVSGTRYR